MLNAEEIKLILDTIDSKMIDVHTWLPGQVVVVYPATATKPMTVDVELQTQRLLETDDGELVAESLGIIHNLPIGLPRADDFFLSMPIVKGTYGKVSFCETSIDVWRTLGKVVNPGDARRHSVTGAVFEPGLYPNKKIITDNVQNDAVLGKIGGPHLRVKAATVEVTTGGLPTATDFVALAAKVDLFISKLDVLIRAWTPVPSDGGAALKAAYVAAFPTPHPSVASTNLKAD